MLPLLTMLIFQAAGGKSLGRLVTYVALPALLGPILGPVIGGAILGRVLRRRRAALPRRSPMGPV